VTAAVIAVGARGLGLSWREALLFGAVVSSTDAAAVFSVLRGRGHPHHRVAAVLELESGLNDPTAVILTLTLIELSLGTRAIGHVLVQIVVGLAAGFALGYGGSWLVCAARLPSRGLYPVMTVGLALLGFGLPTLLQGSGFLAVYLVGIILGSGRMPDRPGVTRVHDSLAWFCQIGMFLLLGLMVHPEHLPPVARVAIPSALLLALVARPLAVLVCLLPFRYSLRETVYIGLMGLRGAVPIILATFPVLAHVEGSYRLFDLVFFVVVIGAIVPGMLARHLAGWLRLESTEPPAPHALLEIASTETLGAEVLSFYIEPASAVSGATIADLPFPDRSAVMLVIRGKDLIAPRGPTVLLPGDHVYVFCRTEDRPLVQLLLGRQEVEG
jgi:cell volume regulation protein A